MAVGLAVWGSQRGTLAGFPWDLLVAGRHLSTTDYC